MNIDIPRYIASHWQGKALLDHFFSLKGPGVTLRTHANSSGQRIIAKWVGDVVVSKNDPKYADVIDPLEEACKARGIYICKVDKKVLSKSDLQLGEMLGQMGLW